MKRKITGGFAIICWAVFTMLTIAWNAAQAQWVPPRGEGSFSVEYQHFSAADHIWSDLAHAREVVGLHDDTDVSGNIVVLSLDYAVYDQLAVTVSLPFVNTDHNAGGVYAAGSGNSPRTDLEPNNAFQDLSVSLRYMAMVSPLMVTTSIGATWPTHDYPTHGHSAIGRNLNTFSAGFTVGRSLAPILADAYLQGGYAYTLSEAAAGMRPNRSNANIGLTYFIPDRPLSLSLYWNQQFAHGGIDWSQLFFPANDFFAVHDQIAAERFGRIGGVVFYQLSHQLGLYAGATKVIDGVSANTQQARAFNLGTTRSF